MAPSFISALVVILAAIFPDIDAGNIGITVNTLVVLVGSMIVMVRQVLNNRSTWFGSRP